MLQKKVKKRASLLAITLLASVTGVFIILQSLNKNILYFKSPTDIKNDQNINFDKNPNRVYSNILSQASSDDLIIITGSNYIAKEIFS